MKACLLGANPISHYPFDRRLDPDLSAGDSFHHALRKLTGGNG
jgi:hypothetical protein